MLLQNSHGDVKYGIGNIVAKKHTHDTWTWTRTWGLPESVGGMVGRGERGENLGNYNGINNKT